MELYGGVHTGGVVTEVPVDLGTRARFEALVAATELPLRRALVAAYGEELGREATADALAWAWEHLDVVEGLDNPGGYLWRVGQTAARRARRWWPRRQLWVASEPLDPPETGHSSRRCWEHCSG